MCPLHAGLPQTGAVQMRASQIGCFECGALQFGALKRCMEEGRARAERVGKVCAAQYRMVKVRADDIRILHPAAVHVGGMEIGPDAARIVVAVARGTLQNKLRKVQALHMSLHDNYLPHAALPQAYRPPGVALTIKPSAPGWNPNSFAAKRRRRLNPLWRVVVCPSLPLRASTFRPAPWSGVHPRV